MEDFKHEILELNDESAIQEYEQSLYRAYVNKNVEWVSGSYQIDDENRRLKSIVDYSVQIVYVLRYKDKIISSMAMNTDLNKTVISLTSYELSSNIEPNIINPCEGLTSVFNVEEVAEEVDFMELFFDFGKYVVGDLQNRGYDAMYGICTRKTKALHTLSGFEVIDKLTHLDKKYFIIKYSISQKGGGHGDTWF